MTSTPANPNAVSLPAPALKPQNRNIPARTSELSFAGNIATRETLRIQRYIPPAANALAMQPHERRADAMPLFLQLQKMHRERSKQADLESHPSARLLEALTADLALQAQQAAA